MSFRNCVLWLPPTSVRLMSEDTKDADVEGEEKEPEPLKKKKYEFIEDLPGVGPATASETA